MKQIKLLLITLLFIIPTKTTATTISLTCPKAAAPNTNINCTLNNDYLLKGIKLKLTSPPEITVNNINTSWNNYYNKKGGLVLTNPTLSQQQKISNISLKISNNVVIGNTYKISITDIEGSDSEHKLITIPATETLIKILSDDKTLSSLTVSNTTLTPTFNKNKTNYTGTTAKDNVTINAKASYKNAKVSGDIGNKKLNYGANRFIITVTSELGNRLNYIVTITRSLPQKNNTTSKTHNNSNKTITTVKSNDASLKSIEVEGYNINFDNNTFNYTLKVANNINNVNIKAIPNNNKSKVQINKPETLVIGDNPITITVTAEDGTIAKYILNIIRKDLSKDTSIKQIIIKNYKLNIKKNKYNYNLKINNEEKLNIKVILNDEKASYKIKGNKELKDGSIITITVAAEDKSTKDYTIKVSKSLNENKNFLNNHTLVLIISITIIITAVATLLMKRIINNKQIK